MNNYYWLIAFDQEEDITFEEYPKCITYLGLKLIFRTQQLAWDFIASHGLADRTYPMKRYIVHFDQCILSDRVPLLQGISNGKTTIVKNT